MVLCVHRKVVWFYEFTRDFNYHGANVGIPWLSPERMWSVPV